MIKKTDLNIENQAAVCFSSPIAGRWRSTQASNSNEKSYLTDSGTIQYLNVKGFKVADGKLRYH
jgi:hypothetical protein